MPGRSIQAELLSGNDLYRTVVLEKMAGARESVWIATANVKAMMVEQPPAPGAGPVADRGRFAPVVALFRTLARRGVELRLLHAELPSRPFRAAFDRSRTLVRGGLQLKICPRVHFKCVRVDGAWVYLGSANLTGAGLGAKHPDARNFELGLVTEDFDTVDRVTALFESVWSGAECGRCRLRSVCPDPIGPPATRPRKTDGIRLGRPRRLRRP
ncbi:MAG TPA: phospholipase D-like domain-containing protein [Myxococcaceae bacterium]|nr:phospholipase D-like domain-containing protein [Myxococcaceae bacterium]